MPWRQPQIPGLPFFVSRKRRIIRQKGKTVPARGKHTPQGVTNLAHIIATAKLARARRRAG